MDLLLIIFCNNNKYAQWFISTAVILTERKGIKMFSILVE